MANKTFRDYLTDSDLPYLALIVLLVHVFFWKFFVPGQMLFGTDTIGQSYPIQVMGMREIFNNHAIQLWNPYMFSGMPFLASFSFHILYPGSWIFFILPLDFAMGYLYVFHFSLMGVLYFYFLRDIGISRQVALVASLFLVFNTHLVSLVYPGHGGKIITFCYLPPALMFLNRAFERKDWLRNMLLMGLMVGLMFYGGHVQILFYNGIALSVFFVVRAIPALKARGAAWVGKAFAAYAAAFGLGVLLYGVVLFPAWEYKNHTHRAGGMTGASSYEFASSFSCPPEDLLYLPLRNPFGWGKDYGPLTPTTEEGIFYRGRMGLKLSTDYFSVIGLVLVATGIFFVRNRYTTYCMILGGLVLFLCLGGFNPFYYYVYKYIPGFSIFRVPYAILILEPLCLVTLLAFGLQWLVDADARQRRKFTLAVLGGGGAVLALTLAVTLLWNARPVQTIDWLLGKRWVQEMLWGDFADVEHRFGYFVKNLFFFITFLATALGVLYVYVKGWMKTWVLLTIVSILCMVELWPVNWDFIKTVPRSSATETYFKETPQIKTIKADTDGQFRVFSLVTNNELLYHGIQSMTGYHAVPLNYIEKYLNRISFDNSLLDMLNARYLMLPMEPDYDFGSYPAGYRERIMDKHRLISADGMYFYRNSAAMPRAWLVNRYWRAGETEEALDIISDPRYHPSQFAVLTEDPPAGSIAEGADLGAQRVEVTRYTPDDMEFKVNAPADAFMVISEIWYPGWRAYVDGKEAKVYRTDYLLRGITVQAGEHKVTMEFSPGLFRLGLATTLLTLAFFAGLFAWPKLKDKWLKR